MSRLTATSLLLLTSFLTQLASGEDSTAERSSIGQRVESSAEPATGPIQDNSFLIEEAYNQEDGVVQHISYVQRSFPGDWVFAQTDEWPLRTIKHQFSVTVTGAHAAGIPGLGMGDTAINYRYQLVGNGEARVAIAPRLSALAPTGDYHLSRGAGGFGVQANLPVSVQHNGHFVSHWNAGFTWIPKARSPAGEKAAVMNVNLGQSMVWLASHRFNVMLENLWTSTAVVVGPGSTARRQDFFISPGVRWAYNFPSGLQIVPGIGLPIGVGPSSGDMGLIFYLSFEHPLRIAHSR